MSANFTKGPWRAEFVQAFPFGVRVVSQDGECVLRQDMRAHASVQRSLEECLRAVGFPNDQKEDAVRALDEQIANARLIAKAPELYEVLRQIVGLDKDANPGLATWMEARCAADKTARALLAEIEGE